jgi:EAL domain-containing protein (putative c-di-GMP-specific phosphodiesterase class I)
MLLPETKEREFRFKLALRMGLPIFALILLLLSTTLISSTKNLSPVFYFEAILLLVFSIYFIFYIIYSGFSVKITDSVSQTFTREYLYAYLKKEIKKNSDYTLILLSVDNLHDINIRYGLQNGDKVLYETVEYLGKYLKDKKIVNFPMGHIKGGDFILGLKGKKEEYSAILDILFLKSNDFKIDDIEINISGAITDTNFSTNLDHLIENLFEIHEENKSKKSISKRDTISPNDLESYVIKAIDSKSVTIMIQDVYKNKEIAFKECFIRLKSYEGKTLHPKAYMKVINKLGLLVEYDLMILEKIVLNSLQKNSNNIAINISPTSLRNTLFLTKVKELLRDNPINHGKIIFIISEVEYYANIQRFNNILKSLKSLGIEIAIDRLGSLHTSFLYLRDLDIDIVRFDSFYMKHLQNPKNRNIIEGLHKTAQSSGVKTWVKMVENRETRESLREIGIDYLQGKELGELNKIYED